MRKPLLFPFLLALAAAFLQAEEKPAPPSLAISADFPGGSAKIESIDQKKRSIRLLPAPHPDRGWVCWWYFKLSGIKPGETVTLDVGGGVWALPEFAAFSLDNKTWLQTAGGKSAAKNRLVYKQKVDAAEAWFAWGPPFVLSHAQELVDRAAKTCPHAKAFELAKSAEGRAVPGLRVSQPGVSDDKRFGVWIQARQHAWESGSSWVCAGLLEFLVSDDPRAEALRKKAFVTIIPVMDADNAERGAGGKEQKPQDHNRDWTDNPHWPEVRAAQKQIAEQNAARRFDLFIDLHNPAAGDKKPFFFISAKELLPARSAANLREFLICAQAEMTGPLKFTGFTKESGPSYDKNWKNISKNWVTVHAAPHVVAVTLETSWNTPDSTQENYKRIGKELCLAIERYLLDSIRSKE